MNYTKFKESFNLLKREILHTNLNGGTIEYEGSNEHSNAYNIVSNNNDNLIQISSNKKSLFLKIESSKIDIFKQGEYEITRSGFCKLCNKETTFIINNYLEKVQLKNGHIELLFRERFYKDYLDSFKTNKLELVKL